MPPAKPKNRHGQPGKAEKRKPAGKGAKRPMPHFAPAPDALVRTFENAMKDFPMAERRKMFGYPAAFVNGNMFTGLHTTRMVLRLPADVAPAMPGAQPFEPLPGRSMTGWYVIPPRILASPGELNGWLEKAFKFTRGLPAKAAARRKL